MKKGIYLKLISLLLLATLVLCGCNKTDPVFYEYFDTVTEVYDYSGKSKAKFAKNLDFIEEQLRFYNNLFDIYNEYDGINNIATLNRRAGEWVELDSALIEFLEYAVLMHDLTDGNMNIAMGSVLSIWHDYRSEGKSIPTMSELQAAAQHTDIKKLEIDKQGNRARLLDPEMSLDVGAIAKGYAVERIAEALEAKGVTSYVIDAGGNLRAIGSKPNGGTWRTGVRNPDTYDFETPYVYYLDIKDTSVVTSGDYQRFYVVDGVKYHHIIDKDTLMPSDNFASVTIVTQDSGKADALSTALFNASYEEGVQILSRFDDVACIWVTKDGQVKKYGI